MGDYKRRPTWPDTPASYETDVTVKHQGRSIARIQMVEDGQERGRWNCNMFWYPPCQTSQEVSLEEGIVVVIKKHKANKGEIQSYYHPIEE